MKTYLELSDVPLLCFGILVLYRKVLCKKEKKRIITLPYGLPLMSPKLTVPCLRCFHYQLPES